MPENLCECQRAVFQLYDLYLPPLGGVGRILVDWNWGICIPLNFLTCCRVVVVVETRIVFVHSSVCCISPVIKMIQSHRSENTIRVTNFSLFKMTVSIDLV